MWPARAGPRPRASKRPSWTPAYRIWLRQLPKIRSRTWASTSSMCSSLLHRASWALLPSLTLHSNRLGLRMADAQTVSGDTAEARVGMASDRRALLPPTRLHHGEPLTGVG